MPSFIHDLNKSQLMLLYFAESKSCTFCANFIADLNLKSFLFILFSLPLSLSRLIASYDHQKWETLHVAKKVCWLRLRAPAASRLMVKYEAQTCTQNNSVVLYDLEESRMPDGEQTPSATWTGCDKEGEGRAYFYVSSSNSLLIALRLFQTGVSYSLQFHVSVVQVRTNYSLLISSLSPTVGKSVCIAVCPCLLACLPASVSLSNTHTRTHARTHAKFRSVLHRTNSSSSSQLPTRSIFFPRFHLKSFDLLCDIRLIL